VSEGEAERTRELARRLSGLVLVGADLRPRSVHKRLTDCPDDTATTTKEEEGEEGDRTTRRRLCHERLATRPATQLAAATSVMGLSGARPRVRRRAAQEPTSGDTFKCPGAATRI